MLILRETSRRLAEAGVTSPDAEARTLLRHLTGRDPYLIDTMDDAQQAGLDDLVARRATGIPLQHLTGIAHFRHVSVAVGPGVFIPRPETEVMTGWAIDRLRERIVASGPQRVVELCAGSAAISLALADELGDAARITAVEMSPEAHAWAERNASGTDIDVLLGDMADPLPDLEGRVDLVICNPPYIPLEAWESVTAEVRDHDPEVALFSGADGLDAIRVLAERAASLLVPGGLVCAEHAEANADGAVDVFARHGAWRMVRDHPDLADRPRFVTAVRVGMNSDAIDFDGRMNP